MPTNSRPCMETCRGFSFCRATTQRTTATRYQYRTGAAPMTLDNWQFADPLKALERKEQRPPCEGCKHRFKVWGVWVCLITEGKAGKAMQRCEKYEIKRKY